MSNDLTPLCAAVDVPADAGLRVDLPDRPPLAVFRLDDAFHVIDDTCTHGDASLCDGYVENGGVECPLHSGRFCIKTGEVLEGPVFMPVKVYRSSVIDGQVCVETSALMETA
jgi:nitrite reductase/ring-hydroxylating ferredoxin subunit